MAVITDADLRELWLSLYRKGEGKEEIKADGLLSPTRLKAIFQVIGDWFEAERGPVKGLITAAAARPVSDAAVQKYVRAWMRRKWRLE